MNHMLKQEVIDKLTELVAPMSGSRILEIGTGWGESATFFANLRPDWTVYTVDAYGLYGDGRIYKAWDHDQVKKVVDSLPINVVQILGDSRRLKWELPIDVLFIDGDHTFSGCLSDWERFGKWVRPGGIIAFDDYTQENNPNNGVKWVVDLVIMQPEKYQLVHKGYYSAIFKKL